MFRGEEGEPHGFSSLFIENLQKGAQIIIVQLRFSQSEHSNISTQNLEHHQPLVSLPFSHYLPKGSPVSSQWMSFDCVIACLFFGFCLGLIFYVNGVLQYVSSCACLFSLSSSGRFILVTLAVVCVHLISVRSVV